MDPAGVQDTAFELITGQAFTDSTTVTIRLANTGAQNSSVLLSGFAITDLGAAPGVPVPEPVSLALAGTGLLGLALARLTALARQRA